MHVCSESVETSPYGGVSHFSALSLHTFSSSADCTQILGDTSYTLFCTNLCQIFEEALLTEQHIVGQYPLYTLLRYMYCGVDPEVTLSCFVRQTLGGIC